MSTLEIDLRERRTNFSPGETLSGEVSWQLQNAAHAIELRLFWFTSGKGTSDVSVEQTRRFEAPALTGKHDFSFHLPLAPHSFAGTLIELTWALEAVVMPGEEATRAEFVLAPGGQKIEFSALGSDDVAAKFPGWLQGKMGFKKPSALQNENPFETTTSTRNTP